MKRSTQRVLQTVLLAMQIIVASDKELSERHQTWGAAIIAALQFYVGDRSHRTNPDGTPAEAAWEKPQSKK